MFSSISVIICHERSGSHLIADYVSQLKSGIYLDEVCNANIMKPESNRASFQRFAYDWAVSNYPESLVPNYDSRKRLITDYIISLCENQNSNELVIDIKYGHLSNFEPFWSHPFGKPLLISVLRSLGCQIVHLYRENVVEYAVSAQISKLTKIWHSTQPEYLAKINQPKLYKIDCEVVVAEAISLERQIAEAKSNWFRNVECIEIEYSKFVDSLNSDRKYLASIADDLGYKHLPFWEPKLKKLGRSLDQSLENYSELKRLCMERGLEKYLCPQR